MSSFNNIIRVNSTVAILDFCGKRYTDCTPIIGEDENIILYSNTKNIFEQLKHDIRTNAYYHCLSKEDKNMVLDLLNSLKDYSSIDYKVIYCLNRVEKSFLDKCNHDKYGRLIRNGRDNLLMNIRALDDKSLGEMMALVDCPSELGLPCKYECEICRKGIDASCRTCWHIALAQIEE